MINNTVYDIDFTRALPSTLKDDETINALGRIIAAELQKNMRLSRLNIIYPRIDELDENILDLLAYDLHIDWYDPDSPPEIKRAIIKDSVKVHKRMGTRYAVERVVATYFGSGEVREWYEYGGEPHHFKIISTNPSITDENAAQFFRILEVVKRKSSWLESILITLTGEMSLCMGVTFHESNHEAHAMGAKECISAFYGTILDERTAEAHIMGAQDRINLYFGALLDERTAEAHAIGSSHYEVIHGALLYERATETYTIKEE